MSMSMKTSVVCTMYTLYAYVLRDARCYALGVTCVCANARNRAHAASPCRVRPTPCALLAAGGAGAAAARACGLAGGWSLELVIFIVADEHWQSARMHV
jgi:hypothetical protein